MRFKIVSINQERKGQNVILLIKSTWDDYTFKTTFWANYFDGNGNGHELGTVKIGKTKMEGHSSTVNYLDTEFDSLPEGFFSLWQTAEAYKRVLECEKDCHFNILRSLKDMAYDPNIYEKYKNEDVTKESLFRTVSYSLYMQQFRRIARGQEFLTPFHFSYSINQNNPLVDNCTLDFSVIPESLPPTNVHAVIGSNGTGKTTLIKSMIKSICGKKNEYGMFKYDEKDGEDGNFENVICISFNPFDNYREVESCSDKFQYIGIRKEYSSEGYEDGWGEISLLDDITNHYIHSLQNCLADATKKDDLREILEILETEYNFMSSNYEIELNTDRLSSNNMYSIEKDFERLSAGHKVVLSIITRCIDNLVEKSVVFIDEPENHLHPPLLSSMIRGISRMLIKRNGVAIISTHSPIVLQEIPGSCTWILNRVGETINARRPEIETFGTNIGVLTNEIFGYEVRRTGFNTLLQKAVDKYNDYEIVLGVFNNQLGDEAKSMIRIMLKQKETL